MIEKVLTESKYHALYEMQIDLLCIVHKISRQEAVYFIDCAKGYMSY